MLTAGLAVVALVLAGCSSPLASEAEDAAAEAGTPNTAVVTTAPPTISPPGGDYPADVEVTVSAANDQATLHVTTDGSEPTTSSPAYSGPVQVAGNGTEMTMRAIAVAPDAEPSDIVSESYRITYDVAAAPTFDPPGGRYSDSVSVEISSTTPGTIYYTTDGSEPDPNDLAGPTEEYSGPIDLPGPPNTTIRALVVATGLVKSDIAEASYASSVQTVTSNAATGPGTLAAALDAAEAGDTIRFAGDMTITAPASLTNPPSWFTISMPLTVDAGDNTVVLDANQAGRQFFVDVGGDLTLLADRSGGGSLPLENGLGVNSDTGSAVAAGSIYVEEGGSLHTVGVQFLNNETSAAGPPRGAGAVLLRGGSHSFSDTVFDGNTADQWGGAISVVRNATVSISESTFRNNHAGRDTAGDGYGGGAMHLQNGSTATITNSLFEDNSAGSGPGQADGGALNINGSLSLSGSILRRNSTGDYGGAIDGANADGLSVSDTVFDSNQAGVSGGAIHMENAALTVSGGEFTENESDSAGGAIHSTEAVTVTGTRFYRNVSTNGNAGAISASGPLTVRDAEFERNEAIEGYGGALRSTGGLLVSGSIFRYNYSSRGGGIDTGAHGTNDRIVTSQFLGNHAETSIADDGGGIYASGRSLRVSSSIFVMNVAGGQGGGIAAGSGTSVRVIWSNFYDNYVSFSNYAVKADQPFIISSIVYGSVGGSPTYTSSYVRGINSYPSTLYQQTPWAGSNKGGKLRDNGDENFGNLRLDPASPAIDSGNLNRGEQDWADLDLDGDTSEQQPYDLDGNPRVRGSAPDRGAYEMDPLAIELP